MMIHREGYRIIGFATLFLLLVNLLLAFIIDIPGWLLAVTVSVSVFKLLFLLFFFRAPQRPVSGGKMEVISPADGKIVALGPAFESEYLKQTCLKISVFMSPLNMHSNRYPVSGRVKEVIYHPGKYFVAWHPKSSELNERSTVVIESDDGYIVVVRQIAGFIARRIVTYPKPGQRVERGDELGFIKFGSRVDLYLPEDFAPLVIMNQAVRANMPVASSH